MMVVYQAAEGEAAVSSSYSLAFACSCVITFEKQPWHALWQADVKCSRLVCIVGGQEASQGGSTAARPAGEAAKGSGHAREPLQSLNSRQVAGLKEVLTAHCILVHLVAAYHSWAGMDSNCTPYTCD